MNFYNRVALRDDLPARRSTSHSRSRHARTGTFLCCCVTPLLVALAASGIVTRFALAGSTGPGTDRISFYGDILDIINNQNSLLVRPSTLLLAEDGSVALVHLRWRGWGTNIARATGVWSASGCTPSCATGKLTKGPARLMLSSPGLVRGHLVYRCFQVSPPHPKRDVEDRACINRQGQSYSEVSAPAQ